MADEDLKKEVWSLLKPIQTASLATVEGDIPRTRPVALVHHDGKLWVATGTQSNKVKQVMLNPNVEFHFPIGDKDKPGYVRGTGKAEIIEDGATRESVSTAMPFFSMFWKSANDANFTLLRLHVVELEYMKPGGWERKRFSAC